MAKNKRRKPGGEREVRYAAMVEMWLYLQEHSGLDIDIDPREAAPKFGRWMGVPRLAVMLMNDLRVSKGLRCEDLRAWEAWPERETFMRVLEAEDDRVCARIERLKEQEAANGKDDN